jgi:hypothetical protein
MPNARRERNKEQNKSSATSSDEPCNNSNNMTKTRSAENRGIKHPWKQASFNLSTRRKRQPLRLKTEPNRTEPRPMQQTIL